MKLDDAKRKIAIYLSDNRHKIDRRDFKKQVNWEIVKLSHDVFRGHGLRGHLIRRKIRRQLWTAAADKMHGMKKPSLLDRLKKFILGHY